MILERSPPRQRLYFRIRTAWRFGFAFDRTRRVLKRNIDKDAASYWEPKATPLKIWPAITGSRSIEDNLVGNGRGHESLGDHLARQDSWPRPLPPICILVAALTMNEKETNEEETALEDAAGEHRPSLTSEFVHFLRENKKWWLAPLLLALAIVGLMVALAGTGAGPFIYSFF